MRPLQANSCGDKPRCIPGHWGTVQWDGEDEKACTDSKHMHFESACAALMLKGIDVKWEQKRELNACMYARVRYT